MKIRNGFVSNSSSSSFHIYGIELEGSVIKEMLLEQKIITEEDLDRYGIWEDIHKLKFGELADYCDYDGDCVYIGRRYSSIKDDETGKEFKKSATKAVAEFLGKDVECQEYLETIYN